MTVTSHAAMLRVSRHGENVRVAQQIARDDLKVLLRSIMRDIDEAAPGLAARYGKD